MSNEVNLSQKTASGVFWVFMERICAQLVSFAVSIVLARLLMPDDYGLIAIVTVLINILNVIVTGGFSTSLIQKKDTDDIDYSSVFWFLTVFSIVAYILLYFAAPALDRFYNYDLLVSVVRVMGLQIIIGGIKSVFSARLTKKTMFKKFFWATFIGTAISAVISFIMAYNGYGVWALVCQYLINNTIDTLILAFVSKWIPNFKVSINRLKTLISFGWKVLVSSLIDTVYNNIRSLIIGARYSSADLAYYNRGKQFPELVMNNISTSISSAIFPALSSKQDSREDVKLLTKKTMQTTSYIVMPLMFGLAMVARPLVVFLLTEKWLPCVPFLQILCFNNALMPLQSANIQSILALGRSDINIKLNVIKKTFGLVVILISSLISVVAMAYAGMITGLFCLILNMYPNKKLLGYGIKEQILDVAPYVLLSAIMSFCIWWFKYIPISPVIQIAVQVSVGALVYIALSVVFKIESLYDILKYVKRIIKR